MFNFIYKILSNYLPDELILLILFKYSGLKHPILNNDCFNIKDIAMPIEKEHIHYIWNERKKNNFSDDVFRCLIKLGNLTFVQNKTDKICNNRYVKKNRYTNKYGLIHYFNYNWLFPMNCNKDTLIKEVSKNIEHSNKSLYNLDKMTRRELVVLYFKL